MGTPKRKMSYWVMRKLLRIAMESRPSTSTPARSSSDTTRGRLLETVSHVLFILALPLLVKSLLAAKRLLLNSFLIDHWIFGMAT